MRIIVTENYQEMSIKAAKVIASQITLKPDSILGLATGSTPVGMYKELINMYKNRELDFSTVKTFNLDEYYGLSEENDQSYHNFMRENLFVHINVKKENINIPNGNVLDIETECENYERMIRESGGIDIQVLGIGCNGHIGFNEPNINFEASTHLVNLTQDTIEANSRFFSSIEEVPTKAISMGIKTIMQSKKILLLANGEAKADVVYEMIKGKILPEVPASILQLHNDVTIVLDRESAAKLKDNVV
ncbi:glucosamine-6-phosphate deaminase [Clostridium aestuarii]|uniref:Glucosamine-6-phosphate deaminase n=1 Tax=Clostridium aestuarii TaxID=338193 RepID=A0ABT4D3D5_9CLOT|nr:glucosamine-6-phosphate deaminase [Clostridium aestuarii]MCY6485741.1 glucosamine-6-phosphate deaminase [Clostridium aestuarii]